MAPIFRSPQMRRTSLVLGAAFGLIAASSSAQADVLISSAATTNIACVSGVCTPTKKGAILNVTQLQNLLASGNVTVSTDGSKASSILVSANLSWASGYSLTLDAYQSITVNKAVSVNGTGALTLTTNDGGTGGALSFGPKGHVTFLSTTNSLTINGAAYTLVADATLLNTDITADPTGDFALAADSNASGNPIEIGSTFEGIFEGLGNTIRNFKNGALFKEIGSQGVVENLILANFKFERSEGDVGGLAGINNGSLFRDGAEGKISAVAGDAFVGGLVGSNGGQITDCFANVSVLTKDGRHGDEISTAGGLVGILQPSGAISNSYATGSVTTSEADFAGGLAGSLAGTVTNSYSTGAVSTQGGYSGGVAGDNGGTLVASYSTGSVAGGVGESGGLIGHDIDAYPVTTSYWDTTTSGITNPSQGAGNISNDPGITGLSTTQLQAGLPAGFSSTIWGESPSINGGLPYLLALPPPG